MIWLAIAALVVGCVLLNVRHKRRLARWNGRRHREIVLPTGVLTVNKRLTAAEAEAIKQAWLKSYSKRKAEWLR